jgi:mRNA-degrading endonuclease RelE of RelBE toxin-antitoxin system
MNWRIITTDNFDKSFSKLDYSIKEKISKEINQLKSNPFKGKPLGYRFFREKKVKGYRIYYLVYEKKVVVFLIAISSKKNQQETINKIKYLIPFYKNYVEENY